MPPRRPVTSRGGVPPLQGEGSEPPRGRVTMENYDEGFEGDVDNEGFFDDPVSTFTGDQAYNTAVTRAQMSKTYYTRKIGDFIKGSTLFPDTKETLLTFVNGLFDKTEVLAKTDNLKLITLDVQIMLAQARLSFHPMDVDNPDLPNTTNMILHHYGRYISRSVGGWERGLQNVMETAHTNTNRVEQRPGMQQFGAPKKPWYRRFI